MQNYKKQDKSIIAFYWDQNPKLLFIKIVGFYPVPIESNMAHNQNSH
jgi:hypothetical protein